MESWTNGTFALVLSPIKLLLIAHAGQSWEEGVKEEACIGSGNGLKIILGSQAPRGQAQGTSPWQCSLLTPYSVGKGAVGGEPEQGPWIPSSWYRKVQMR